MSDECDRLVSELEGISSAAQKTFGGLSAAQINWRPNAESWSAGQCFEHLMITNRAYFEELDKIAAGTRKNSFWERWSPLTSFGGKMLIDSLKSDARKVKTIQKMTPPSAVDARVIELFAAHQAELAAKIKRIESADWRKIVLTSPFMGLMTYNLADGLESIIEHEKRHFRQAERVVQSESFPK